VEEIFKITKDIKQALALKALAIDRLGDIKELKKAYKIVEEYYEAVKELATALMYANGYKTLSHKALFIYLKKQHGKHFSESDFRMMDKLRITRNEIVYYGKGVDKAFLINNEVKVKEAIGKLLRLLDSEI